MSTSAFVQLCTGFCELAQTAAPTLEAQASGVLAFHTEWKEVTVDVIYHPTGDAGHTFVIFKMGAIDTNEGGAADLLALLHANFLSLRANAPTFSVHPATGDAVLQCVFPMVHGTPHGLHALIEEGVMLVLRWRNGRFSTDHPENVHAPAPMDIHANQFA
ncbi:MAG: CesT family type III secretion system chaperone [Burkholderiaceae bacterium]|nr:CesT family type III secretion system chaperone [Burkholderiaceae bacterium]